MRRRWSRRRRPRVLAVGLTPVLIGLCVRSAPTLSSATPGAPCVCITTCSAMCTAGSVCLVMTATGWPRPSMLPLRPLIIGLIPWSGPSGPVGPTRWSSWSAATATATSARPPPSSSSTATCSTVTCWLGRYRPAGTSAQTVIEAAARPAPRCLALRGGPGGGSTRSGVVITSLGPSVRPPPPAWPVMPSSSGPTSARTVRPSMWAGPAARSAPPSVGRWLWCTGVAGSRVVRWPFTGASSTTSWLGTSAGAPTSTTPCRCAGGITTSSTNNAGPSPAGVTAGAGTPHPTTPAEPTAATRSTTPLPPGAPGLRPAPRPTRTADTGGPAPARPPTRTARALDQSEPRIPRPSIDAAPADRRPRLHDRAGTRGGRRGRAGVRWRDDRGRVGVGVGRRDDRGRVGVRVGRRNDRRRVGVRVRWRHHRVGVRGGARQRRGSSGGRGSGVGHPCSVAHFGGIRMPPSTRMTSAFMYGLVMSSTTMNASSSDEPNRLGNSTLWPRWALKASDCSPSP